MKEEIIAQKWRLIKLSKTRPILAFRLVNTLSEKCGEEVYKMAFEYGEEKGREVMRNLKLKDFREIAKFLSMISGTRIEQKGEEIVFLSCPVNILEQVKSARICKGYIEGFFSAFGMRIEALPTCGEQCKILIRQTRS
ncbi:MAG: hypothetical protein QXT98_07260 [Archaeoglobaceae archaeon]